MWTLCAHAARRWSGRVAWLVLTSVVLLSGASLQTASPQTTEVVGAEPQAVPSPQQALLTGPELDDLVGPIALYPDDLLALVLPASTYPLQVVQASRFLERRKSSPDLEPGQDWDGAVVALLHYPEVIDLMNRDLDWTQTLGDAVVYQQDEVMDAIQQVRSRALAAGNLQSNEQQVIVREKEIITIVPAKPEVIYVPTYNPQVVVVQQPAPTTVVTYSNPYPYYYSPAATFFTGALVGAAMVYAFDWGRRDIHYHYHGRGPYYRPGYPVHYGKTNINIDRSINIDRGDRNVWKPNRRPSQLPARGREGLTRPATRPQSADVRRGLAERSGQAARPATRPAQTGAAAGAKTRPAAGGRGDQAKGAFGNYQRGANAWESSRRGADSRSLAKRSQPPSGSRDLQRQRSPSGSAGAFSGAHSGDRAAGASKRGSVSRSASRGDSGRSGGSRGGARGR